MMKKTDQTIMRSNQITYILIGHNISQKVIQKPSETSATYPDALKLYKRQIKQTQQNYR